MSLGLKASADGTQITLQLGGVDLMTLSAAGMVSGPLASNAEAQALTSLLKLLTPGTLNTAFQGANQSLAANGYQKLPGGLIIQWGALSATAAGAGTAITFPVAFPTAVRNINITLQNPSGSTTTGTVQMPFVLATSVTTSGFTAQEGGSGSFAGYWLAIGY